MRDAFSCHQSVDLQYAQRQRSIMAELRADFCARPVEFCRKLNKIRAVEEALRKFDPHFVSPRCEPGLFARTRTYEAENDKAYLQEYEGLVRGALGCEAGKSTLSLSGAVTRTYRCETEKMRRQGLDCSGHSTLGVPNLSMASTEGGGECIITSTAPGHPTLPKPKTKETLEQYTARLGSDLEQFLRFSSRKDAANADMTRLFMYRKEAASGKNLAKRSEGFTGIDATASLAEAGNQKAILSPRFAYTARMAYTPDAIATAKRMLASAKAGVAAYLRSVGVAEVLISRMNSTDLADFDLFMKDSPTQQERVKMAKIESHCYAYKAGDAEKGRV